MPRSIAAFLGAALCGVSLSAVAQTPAPHRTCPFHATITDEDGGPIRAFVLLRNKRGTAVNQPVPVDPRGEFKISIAPGFYDLFISAPGFQPLAQAIDLHACKPLNLNLTLFFDPDEHRDDGP